MPRENAGASGALQWSLAFHPVAPPAHRRGSSTFPLLSGREPGWEKQYRPARSGAVGSRSTVSSFAVILNPGSGDRFLSYLGKLSATAVQRVGHLETVRTGARPLFGQFLGVGNRWPR